MTMNYHFKGKVLSVRHQVLYILLFGGLEQSPATRSKHVCPEAIRGLGGRWPAQPRPIHGSAGGVSNSQRP